MSPAARRALGGGVTLAALVAVLLPAAPAFGVPTGAAGAPDRALSLLQRSIRSARALTYGGVQYTAAWSGAGSATDVVEVSHLAGHGAVLRPLPTTSTPAAGVTDEDADVPAQDSAAVGILAADYGLVLAGQQPVAGRLADVVEARRPGGTLAARFYLDHATGLLLERQVYDTAGRLLRFSAFSSVTVGSLPAEPPTANGAARLTSMPAPWRELGVGRAAALRRHGWAVPMSLGAGPSGGRLVLDDVRVSATGAVVHLFYTDGLSTVSVFEQRGRLSLRGLPGWRLTHLGGTRVFSAGQLPAQLTWSGQHLVYTVVADAPSAQLTSVVRALPHARPPGLWTRLRHGLGRLGSWLDPF